MSDNGRWATALLRKYGANLGDDVKEMLQGLPPWIGDLGEPVDELRDLVDELLDALATAETSAQKYAEDASKWQDKYDEAQASIKRLEDELDEAKEDVTRLEDGLDEARAELRG